MSSKVGSRLLKLEQTRQYKARCSACGHAPRDLGPSPPLVTLYGDPNSPENRALVDSQCLRGCDVCGWKPRLAVVIVRVCYDQGPDDDAA